MTPHTRVFPSLFSSMACREGEQGTRMLMQHFKNAFEYDKGDKPGVFGYTGHT